MQNLTIVIHAEEEFDWDDGFFRKNNQVTHHKELIEFVESILEYGCHVVMTMDYAFVNHENGQKVIKHFRSQKPSNFEFGAHLHPWVNPPFDEPSNEKTTQIEEFYSYPGNLSESLEFQKLDELTKIIEFHTGVRPTSYLAGRYGVGENTYQTLKKLGYKVDFSVSAFANFTHQQGPDFSQFDNGTFENNGIKCIPHTTGCVSYWNKFTDYLNSSPQHLERINRNLLGKILLKFAGVKKVRLSPEGYELKDMLALTNSLARLGVENLVFSFHSPSVKEGCTPYVLSPLEHKKFWINTNEYLQQTAKLTTNNFNQARNNNV